jgi:putative ubiquitin-RnfH superfamily antitoxin RatB of RatAB toxin-antitoxin module
VPASALAAGVEIEVEVVHAGPLRVVARTYRLLYPATVADALRVAAGDAAFADIDLGAPAVGVFGRLVSRDDPLTDGDRVEIYRPLAADPKTARRARVREERRRR